MAAAQAISAKGVPMSRSRFHRALFTFVLGVVLTASWASAAETRRPSAPRRATHSVTTARDLFTRLWVLGSLIKEGCGADPHGLCSPSPGATPASVQWDAGCGADPHGGCASGG